jgi:hypothetical protein
MLQRIQSIWLLLASICAFLTIKLSFYSGNKFVDGQKTFVKLTAVDTPIYLLILSVAVGLGSLISIFLFKDRKTQMRITIATLLLSILNVVLYIMEAQKFEEGNYDLTSVFVFAVPVFLILALRGIYRDQKLVKSLDRLR